LSIYAYIISFKPIFALHTQPSNEWWRASLILTLGLKFMANDSSVMAHFASELCMIS